MSIKYCDVGALYGQGEEFLFKRVDEVRCFLVLSMEDQNNISSRILGIFSDLFGFKMILTQWRSKFLYYLRYDI